MKLIEKLQQHTPLNQITETPLSGLILYGAEDYADKLTYLQNAGIYFCLQGQKILRIEETETLINAGEMLVYTTNLPITTKITQASADKPYLALSLALNDPIIERLINQMPEPPTTSPAEIAPISTALLATLERLIDLLNSLNDQVILYPLIQTEIYYYLLKSELGGTLYRLIHRNTTSTAIFQAVQRLQQHFDQAISMEQLASQVGMSSANFYRRFKEITGYSPLQYQKNIRLLEARKRINLGQQSITTVAYEVGYQSLSQFSREFKHYFGHSPKEKKM